MGSAQRPLWLEFKNADPFGAPMSVILKTGDDLRQDILTLQILKVMDGLWKKQGLNLLLVPYRCVATGEPPIHEFVRENLFGSSPGLDQSG